MNDPAVPASPPAPADRAGSASDDAGRAGSRSAAVSAGQASEGMPDELERLVAIHAEQVTRLVRRLLGWRGDVDDVVQDVFVAVLKGWARFDRRSAESTWITRIAINCCRSHQRRAALKNLLWFKLVHQHPLSIDAERSAEQGETQEQVRQAIARLSARDREVIVLRYLEELPPEEIAQVCNVSRGSVEVRLSRARAKLEGLLQPLVKP